MTDAPNHVPATMKVSTLSQMHRRTYIATMHQSTRLVVQTHDGRDASVHEILMVVLWRERPVSPEVLRNCSRASDGEELARDDPVEVTILDLLEVQANPSNIGC